MKPDANGVFVIAGENEQGKSSVLDALAGCLGGREHKPDMPVRKGAESAEVIAETEDLVITAKWTEKSYRVVVENRDGSRHRAPQSVLDSFYTSFTLDPEEFSRLKDKDKIDVLRRLTGIQTGELDQEYQALYEQRTEVSREAKILQTQAAGMKVVAKPEGEIPDEVSVVELSKKKTEAMTVNAENDKKRQLAQSLKIDVDRVRTSISDQQQRIAALAEECRKAKERHEAAIMQEISLTRDLDDKIQAAHDAKVASDRLLDIATCTIDLAMDEAAAKNKARANKLFQLAEHTRSTKMLETAQQKANDKAAEAERITAALKDVEQKKKTMFDEAKLPMEGLTFNEEGVFVNGIPFSQISSSEQIRFGIRIAAATKPNLRLILIRNADLLGDPKMHAVHEEAKENDMLVLCERRQMDGHVGIILEEGRLKEPPNTEKYHDPEPDR